MAERDTLVSTILGMTPIRLSVWNRGTRSPVSRVRCDTDGQSALFSEDTLGALHLGVTPICQVRGIWGHTCSVVTWCDTYILQWDTVVPLRFNYHIAFDFLKKYLTLRHEVLFAYLSLFDIVDIKKEHYACNVLTICYFVKSFWVI